MKDELDEYLEELDALERRERLYRRIRHTLRCIGYFLIGVGIYHVFELIWRICTR